MTAACSGSRRACRPSFADYGSRSSFELPQAHLSCFLCDAVSVTGYVGLKQELAGSTPLQRLAGDVPHGFFKRTMFDAFVEYKVPLARACWLVKLLYFSRHRCCSYIIQELTSHSRTPAVTFMP